MSAYIRPRPWRRGFAGWTVLTLALLAVVWPVPAGAQATSAASYPLPIAAARCEQIPTTGRDQFPPPGCIPLAGAKVQVTTGNNTPFGSCVTNAKGMCNVAVRYNSMVIVMEDARTLPTGYAPLGNPIMTWVYTEFAGASFYNVKANLIPPSPSVGGAALTIHSRVCPAGYSGHTYFQDCHKTAPTYKQWLFLRDGGRSRAAQVRANGNLMFADLLAGDIQLQPGLPDATSRVIVFCSKAATPGTEYPSTLRHSQYEPANSYTVLLTLQPGASILCDLYAVPNAA